MLAVDSNERFSGWTSGLSVCFSVWVGVWQSSQT